MNVIFAQWLSSLKQYLQMSLFLSSPAKLPVSPPSIGLTLIAYITVGELLLGDQKPLISIILQIGFEVIILFCICFIVLKLINKPERLLQTLSALIGVSLIISLLSLFIMRLLPDSGSMDDIDPLFLKINLIILLWNLAVISLIFKRSFEIRTVVAGFIALNYFVFYEFLLLTFF